MFYKIAVFRDWAVNGTAYQRQAAIKDLLTTFFEKFPGTQMETEVESIRLIGPVAIEEGTRVTSKIVLQAPFIRLSYERHVL